jgi:sec-independent protein translocase protein TatA
MLLIIGMPGGQEILVIALVLLVLFGGAKIPALMRGMGQGIREFRKELRGDSEADENESKGSKGEP